MLYDFESVWNSTACVLAPLICRTLGALAPSYTKSE